MAGLHGWMPLPLRDTCLPACTCAAQAHMHEGTGGEPGCCVAAGLIWQAVGAASQGWSSAWASSSSSSSSSAGSSGASPRGRVGLLQGSAQEVVHHRQRPR
jgi:hypothetical protein